MPQIIRWCPAFLCLLTVAGCGSGKIDDGLVKHQVKGSVYVNGTPTGGIAVVFNHTDTSVKGNAAKPVAVTDASGQFALSTNGPQDGAVAGEYIVTFFWPRGGTSSQDFLKGRYTDAAKSKYRATIGDGDAELKPFELEAPEADVAAAKKALEKPAVLN
jgi:hypothetical protein